MGLCGLSALCQAEEHFPLNIPPQSPLSLLLAEQRQQFNGLNTWLCWADMFNWKEQSQLLPMENPSVPLHSLVCGVSLLGQGDRAVGIIFIICCAPCSAE